MELKTIGIMGIINAILAFAVQIPLSLTMTKEISTVGLVFYAICGAILVVGSVFVFKKVNLKLAAILLIIGGVFTLLIGIIGIIAGILTFQHIRKHKK